MTATTLGLIFFAAAGIVFVVSTFAFTYEKIERDAYDKWGKIFEFLISTALVFIVVGAFNK